MKRLLFLILVFSALPAAARLTAGWQSTVLDFGAPLVLTVKGDMDGEPRLIWQQPDFLTAAGVQRNFYSINGRGSGSFTCLFTLDTPGTFQLPEVKVEAGGETIIVPAAEVTLRPPQFLLLDGSRTDAETGGKMIRAAGELPQGRIYTGMTVPLTLRLELDSRLAATVTELPRFKGAERNAAAVSFVNGTKEEDGDETFAVYTFTTWVRPAVSGSFAPEIFSPVNILLASRRETVLNIPYTFPEAQVLPLPPVPAGKYFTGAVGDYNIYCRVTGKEFTTGSALVLQVHIQPASAASAFPDALALLTAPEFSWENCRVYPPEIQRREDGSAVIEYVFVPLRPGELRLPGEFAVFNTVAGEYTGAGVAEKINILQGSAPLPPAPLPDRERIPSAGSRTEDSGSSFPFWLKPPRGGRESGLIYIFIIAAAAAGPAAVLLGFAVRIFLARTGAAEEKKKVLQKLRSAAAAAASASPEEFRRIMDEDILPALRTAEGLAGGSSLEEIAGSLSGRQEELASALAEYAACAYIPGGIKTATAGKICKELQKYALLIVLGIVSLALPLAGADPAPEEEWQKAREACAAGNWQEGTETFTRLLQKFPRDPALWYDLGVCAANSGEWGKAVWRFAGANQLAPNDMTILDALNTAEKTAGVPLTGSMEDPGAVLRRCRDMFRPAQWLLTAAVCWSLLWLLAGLPWRRHIPKGLFRGACVLLVILILCALTARHTQDRDTFAADRGIITADAPLLSLPGGVNARESARCRQGEGFKLLTVRGGFWRITSSSGSTGWIEAEKCGLLPDSIPAAER